MSISIYGFTICTQVVGGHSFMDDREGRVDPAEEALARIHGGLVLDVATGSGGFVNYLRDNLKDYREIIGIDTNEHPLETARQNNAQENVQFLMMNAAKMDFPDGHFDTVCMANSMHHMSDLPAVLSEMKRVCKPGGQVIISEMFRDDQSEAQLTHVYMHHWWAAIDTAQGITHWETFTRSKIIELVESLDFYHRQMYESKDLDANPKEPGMIKQLDGIIDRYIQRTSGLDAESELRQQGERLRQRLHEVGFHGATTLLLIGER